MHKFKIIFVVIPLLGAFGLARAQTPVMVGGEADLDACGGAGVVVGLNTQVDNFLAVRNGTGSQNEMIDKINTDMEVTLCDNKGDWIGIVYSHNSSDDCGVSSPIAVRKPYDGPCKSGWVFRKYLRQFAG